MRDFAIILAANLVSISLIGLAAYMYKLGKPGAGWVILAAVLIASSPEFKKDKSRTPPTDQQNP